MFDSEYFMADLSRRYYHQSGTSPEIRQYCRIEGLQPESLGRDALVHATECQAEPTLWAPHPGIVRSEG